MQKIVDKQKIKVYYMPIKSENNYKSLSKHGKKIFLGDKKLWKNF